VQTISPTSVKSIVLFWMKVKENIKENIKENKKEKALYVYTVPNLITLVFNLVLIYLGILSIYNIAI
jgi:hypothetical protein